MPLGTARSLNGEIHARLEASYAEQEQTGGPEVSGWFASGVRRSCRGCVSGPGRMICPISRRLRPYKTSLHSARRCTWQRRGAARAAARVPSDADLIKMREYLDTLDGFARALARGADIKVRESDR